MGLASERVGQALVLATGALAAGAIVAAGAAGAGAPLAEVAGALVVLQLLITVAVSV